MKKLLRNIIDPYSFNLQNAQLTRPRIYNDADQHYDFQHPKDAPRWTHIEQADNEIVYDDENDSIFDAYNHDDDHNNDDHNNGHDNGHDNDHNNDFISYWFDKEPPQEGETSTMGMIRGALTNANQNDEEEKKEGNKKGKGRAKVSKHLHILRYFKYFRILIYFISYF